MRTRIALSAAAAVLAAATLDAQTITIPRSGGTYSVVTGGDPDRAMLGISTSSSGRRDTLGLLVSSVTAGGPAEKAGIEEGNRLVSINGVNLKLARDDADDEAMQGVNQNRLTREMRKVKAGDEVTLEVWYNGRSRQVKVKTVAASDLEPARRATVTARADDRPALGLSLSATGSRRDTVGVFVQSVSEGGPADKAGIMEGDRIASVNGVDLRVPREDAGDMGVSSSRIDRLQREVRKMKVGDAAELVVVSSGRSRTVRVTTVKAAELPAGDGYAFGFGNGMLRFNGPAGATVIRPDMRAMPRISEELERELPRIREEIEREMPRIREELERELPRIRRELKIELPPALEELRMKRAPGVTVRTVRTIL